MLTKLAFKNAQKGFRDYAVYFLTLVLGVAVFYMFNSIYAQEKIMSVTETAHQAMRALSQILSYISVFVSVVLGFLIVYANNFFIKRRKKELGVYLTLGMEKRHISVILVLETVILALVALVVGLFGGVLLSQFMSFFTARIFEADLTSYKFVFAPEAMFKSILYFGIIFAIVIIFNTIAISRYKLINLLYADRKNENLKIKNIWTSIMIFIISIICLLIAYYLILTNGMVNINWYFLSSLIFGTIGTMLFFYSLAGILTKIVQSNKKLYYKNLNMFILRQLGSKINTNFVSISIVCITLLLTIGIFSCGYSMQHILSNDLRNNSPYDVSLYNYSNEEKEVTPIYDNLPDSIKNSKNIDKYAELNIYIQQGLHYQDLNIDLEDNLLLGGQPLDFIKLSDYNEILESQDKSPVTLEKNKYIVVQTISGMDHFCNQFAEKKVLINIGNVSLTPTETTQKVRISNSVNTAIIFVINDKYANTMTTNSDILNINCVNADAASNLVDNLDSLFKTYDYDSLPFVYYTSRAEVYKSSITTKALISFLAIYLGIVFMITCAAILAIQQLSEAADNKHRYDLLKKLGADKKMLNKTLLSQIACYFLLPLSLAIIHSAVGLTAANREIQYFGQMDITMSILATAIFVIVVYGAYFAVTYVGCKNIISKK